MMNLKKIILLIIILLPLNACIQSTALMGPGVTIATTGNIAQAGLQYGTNKMIEEQTGKDTLGLIKETLEDKSLTQKINKTGFDEKRFKENFKKLVEKKFYKTRSQMFYN